jgi:glycerol-3-phosphate dehydrogenase
MRFEVAVIGAGVVGSAIARALRKSGIEAVLIEASADVGTGTSKGHTSILHTGFDANPESLEARLLRRGYQLMLEYVATSGVPLERTGALLVAWSEDQLERLPHIRANAEKNGVMDTRIISAEEVRRMEPHLGDNVLGGLLVPGEFVICPYSPTLGFAYEFTVNGGTILLNSPVTGVTQDADGFAITVPDQVIHSRWLINAAGLHSDTIDRMLGYDRFTVTPRRGELIVYDKFARGLLTHPILPIPTARTKGVLISPTVFGNIVLGPTAEDLEDKTDTSSSIDGVNGLLEKGRKMLPDLFKEEVTAVYAGLRAATEHKDYQLHLANERNYCCVGGIRSTGVSASLGIAEYVTQNLVDAGVASQSVANWQVVRMPQIGEQATRPYRDPDMLAANPDYGRIVCHCEKVSLGEIKDALRAPVPARNIDGLRRRTRCLKGRCQGFYCLAELRSLLTSTPN